MSDYIVLNECKHGYLYKVFSRNLSLGIFNEKTLGFTGIRNKFDYEYLDTEYHWDTKFGTVHPKKELEECPKGFTDTEELFQWLKKKEKEYEVHG